MQSQPPIRRKSEREIINEIFALLIRNIRIANKYYTTTCEHLYLEVEPVKTEPRLLLSLLPSLQSS